MSFPVTTTRTRDRLAALQLENARLAQSRTPVPIQTSGTAATSTATRARVAQLELENARLRNSTQVAGTRTRDRLAELEIENAVLRAHVPTASGTSSRTREALAAAEQENRRLRTVVVRTVARTSTETLRALQRLEEENQLILGALRTLDVLYMLDCTRSMTPWIQTAAAKVKDVAQYISAQFPDYTIRYGFLGYRDFENSAADRFTELVFTDQIDQLQRHLDATQAIGNTDDAENVVGALAKVVQYPWRARTRVLYHFADCPSHFTQFHDDNIVDHHPTRDPDGRTARDAENFVRELGTLGIDYHFVEIKEAKTRKMITEFRRFYDNEADERKLQILSLGSDTEMFLPSVVKTISSSVARTIRMEQTRVARMIQNDDVNIDPHIDWDHAEGWGERLSMRTYTCNPQQTLDNIIQARLPNVLTSNIQAFIRSEPFAFGGLRYALPMFQSNNLKLVAKMFKDGPHTKDRYLQAMAVQTIAAKLAAEFNSSRPPQLIGFLTIRVVEIEQTNPSNNTYFTVEPFIQGDYVRHHNNNDEPMEAYSHFTWQRSRNRLIVDDLQGVGYMMTDPVIHSINLPNRFGTTDLGREGVDNFFSTHRCNYICRMLHLTPVQPRNPIRQIQGVTGRGGSHGRRP
ncbi:hypothetical protein BC938DRAFT_481756 [Jimgerdemannia flammicorona]|uniref:Alpha-type protein kinase domain-containing protein n=1 Tax=Jimgerdemannia flammicorona TaxID=994334 RepID=A0A433QFH0_9FUNG|nr:hypothetical protein BC938DRAFT_481756 [Jimgerdemannia flammicorona]